MCASQISEDEEDAETTAGGCVCVWRRGGGWPNSGRGPHLPPQPLPSWYQRASGRLFWASARCELPPYEPCDR